MLVVDCSIVGPLALADEPALSEETVSALAAGPLIAPVHWPLESMNMLVMAERRGRIDLPGRRAAVARLRELAVAIDPATGHAAWTDTARLADLHKLTIYDAAYLELAVRRSATLATRDGRLAEAAHAESIATLS